MMGFAKIIQRLPQQYAGDIKTNIAEIFINKGIADGMSDEQFYGVALTCGYTLKDEDLLNDIRFEAKMFLEDSYANACKLAAVMMSMNNTYYSFVRDLFNDDELNAMESELQMNSIKDPGVPLYDFEMFALAASIINKCKYCVNFHTKKLITRGTSKKTLRDIARIASVLKAASEAFSIENMRSYDFNARGSIWS